MGHTANFISSFSSFTNHGGDEIPGGTFHGGDEIPGGTFHGAHQE